MTDITERLIEPKLREWRKKARGLDTVDVTRVQRPRSLLAGKLSSSSDHQPGGQERYLYETSGEDLE